MDFNAHKATRHQKKLRMALMGPTGSGKTWTALEVATGIGGRVCMIDTENKSSELYADKFAFDVIDLRAAGGRMAFAPDSYVKAIEWAARQYDVVVVDSLSHAWEGENGALDMVDKKAGQGGNTFAGWKDVRPEMRKLIAAITGCKAHLIVTLRTKTEWVLETNAKGRQVPRKVGTKPVMADGIEYEVDVALELDSDNKASVVKTRCADLSGREIVRPDSALGQEIGAWLNGGSAPAKASEPAASPAEASLLDAGRKTEPTATLAHVRAWWALTSSGRQGKRVEDMPADRLATMAEALADPLSAAAESWASVVSGKAGQ